jgi:glycosyltransferase involved in cell wall biosynthesis
MGEPARTARRPKLLFVVSEDWYFCSHRLPLAVVALARGYDVVLATRVKDHGGVIRDAGIRIAPIEMQRRSMNLVDEVLSIRQLRHIVAVERPDIVHNVAIKPVLHGSIAARTVGGAAVVNAIAGMGYVFSSSSIRARAVRPIVELALRILLGGKAGRVIVQNPEDRAFLIQRRLAPASRISLIRGSGVDTAKFAPMAQADGTPVVMLASRMLRDKGIPDFVAAAHILLDRDVRARFVLVGGPDAANPASLSEQELRELTMRDGIEWWGRRDDMPAVFGAAHVVCLPTTYGEGIPKVLLEAAACARPIVATDVQGCREIVQPGANGLLVPPRDPDSLADAITRLLTDEALRHRMGEAGRLLVQREFSIEHVVDATLNLYDELLDSERR